jgi:hypothetical protein
MQEPEVVSTYLERDVAEQLRARARAGDRTLSSELRRCVRIALGAKTQDDGGQSNATP